MSLTINYIDLTAPDADSTLSAFNKCNDNFEAIYDYVIAIDSGSGSTGATSFVELSDTPNTLYSYSFPFTNSAGDQFNLMEFGSDSDLDPGAEDTIEFDYSHPYKVVMKVRKTGDEVLPAGSEDIDMSGYRIANTGPLTSSAVSQFNIVNGTSFTINDFLIDKGYSDSQYYAKGNPIILSGNYESITYVLDISNYFNGYAIVNNHMLSSIFNGTPVIFNAESNEPAMVSNGQTYYIRYIDSTKIALYTSYDNAITQDDSIAESTRIQLSGTVSGHTLTFSDLDTSLTGDYLSTQVVPRKDLILKHGDKMEGSLILDDHPSPYTGQSLNDTSLLAASKYYVDQLVDNVGDSYALKDRSVNTLLSGDILGATGLRRIIVDGLVDGDWSIGQSFDVNGSPDKTGIVKDKKQQGQYFVITYQSGPSVIEKDDIIDNGVSTATVIDEFQEISQSRFDASSDVSISITRNEGAEYYNSGSVSNVTFDIKDDIITNSMIKSDAAIDQSKLNISIGTIYDESDPTNGWEASLSVKKEHVGLSAFSNENFESSGGYIRIRDNGISLDEIATIPTNTVLGTLDTGNVISLPFSDIVENGGGILIDDVENTIFGKFDSSIFVYNSVEDELTLRNNGVYLNKLQNISSGVLLGRTLSGLGPIHEISIETLLENTGGMSADELGSEFNFNNDTLSLNTNSVSLNKLEEAPPMIVVGNSWSTSAPLHHITLATSAVDDSVCYRKSHGEISCSELQLNEKKILKSTTDALMAYTPSGQLIFTATCGDSCDFNETETDFNGRVRAVTLEETSDIRKKKDVVQIKNALDAIGKIRGVRFNWVETGQPSMGLIAQELERVIPEAVHTGSDGFKSISYTNLIGLLVEGIKELDNDTYTSDKEYDMGTLVSMGNHTDCTITTERNDSTVIGVIEKYEDGKVSLFARGKAKCKILGPAKKGDLLVSSSIPGYAMVDNQAPASSVFGKCMSNKTDSSKRIIDIWVN